MKLGSSGVSYVKIADMGEGQHVVVGAPQSCHRPRRWEDFVEGVSSFGLAGAGRLHQPLRIPTQSAIDTSAKPPRIVNMVG